MGCWSESCAISGLEIGYGDKLYTLTVGQLYGEPAIHVPPVLGTYDDYGGADLLEDLVAWGRKTGDNWCPIDDKKGQPMYVAAEVFDFLPSLEVEFQRDDIKTIDDKWRKHRRGIVQHIEESIRRREKFGKNAEFFRGLMNLHQAFGYTDRVVIGATRWFEQRIFKGASLAELEAPLDLYGRAYILLYAFRELRKAPAAGARGPQHGGSQALLPFYRKVIEISEAREADRKAWSID
ncbi:MAG: hypothetical protein DI537_14455 [Stutzerimonas stutzeri]|nr:MAG: hypothetical protein DI537_14455 [Stutzerimonas stutzeri]